MTSSKRAIAVEEVLRIQVLVPVGAYPELHAALAPMIAKERANRMRVLATVALSGSGAKIAVLPARHTAHAAAALAVQVRIPLSSFPELHAELEPLSGKERANRIRMLATAAVLGVGSRAEVSATAAPAVEPAGLSMGQLSNLKRLGNMISAAHKSGT